MDIEQAASTLEDSLAEQPWFDAVDIRDDTLIVLLTAQGKPEDVQVPSWHGWPVRAERSFGVRTRSS